MLYADRLNGIVEDIGSTIGYMATCTLVEWYGGRDLWVPTVADGEHEIAKIIGLRNFRSLVEMFPGQRITVPTDFFRDVARRDRIVTMMVQRGEGTKTIAATIGMTERQVQNIRQRLESAGVLSLAGIVPSTGGGA